VYIYSLQTASHSLLCTVTCISKNGDGSDDDSAAAKDEDQDMKAVGLGDKILAHWNVRKASLIHYVSITVWALAISPEICEDVKKWLSDDDRNAIE
jgi:hypothetical protein